MIIFTAFFDFDVHAIKSSLAYVEAVNKNLSHGMPIISDNHDARFQVSYHEYFTFLLAQARPGLRSVMTD